MIREYSHAAAYFDWDSSKWFVNVYAFYGNDDYVCRFTLADNLNETQAHRLENKVNRLAKQWNALYKKQSKIAAQIAALDTFNKEATK